MSDFPYMPLYWKDWLTGTATSSMTPEQEGAFLNLLLRAWGTREPPCSLPNDEIALAQLSRIGPARWKKVGALVLAQFQPIADQPEHLRNRKQWKVYLELQERRERRSAAGRKGNVVRWGDTETAPEPEPSQCDVSAIATSSPAVAVAVADETDKQSPTDCPAAGAAGEVSRLKSASHRAEKRRIQKDRQPDPHAVSAQAIVAHLDTELKRNGLAGIPSDMWGAAHKKVGNALRKHTDLTADPARAAITWAFTQNGNSYLGRVVRDDGAQNLGAIWLAWRDRDQAPHRNGTGRRRLDDYTYTPTGGPVKWRR
jgi:uncharacterized protein YdaU (DUF1376 family)